MVHVGALLPSMPRLSFYLSQKNRTVLILGGNPYLGSKTPVLLVSFTLVISSRLT